MRTTPSSSAAAPHDPRYRVGTLAYTQAGLFVLFGWLLWGDFCFTLFESIGGPNILGLFLQDNFHVSNVRVNLIFNVFPNLIGVIVGPILSFKSDRHRGPRGRRIPFILWTTPFLCFFAAAIGFSDDIVAFAKAHVSAGGPVSPFTVALLLIGLLVVGFSFFNEFVNTVYWYLFADVVPEHFMGRFMGLFRLVGAAAGFLINIAIAAHQLTHMRLISTGVAVLYFVGFSLMCWRVKEGQYPPVTDVTDRSTFLDQVKLYLRECFTHRMFILVYLSTFAFVFARALGMSGVFGLHLGQHLAATQAHTGRAALAETSDGGIALTGGPDGRVSLWDTAHPEQLPSPVWDGVRRSRIPPLRTLLENGPAVTAVALAPDGAWAAAGDAAGGLRLWPAGGGRPLTNAMAHAGPVLALAASFDGTQLASGGADGVLQIWSPNSGVAVLAVPAHTGAVRCVAFARNGRHVVSGGADGLLRVYATADGALVRTIRTPGPLYAVTFAPALRRGPGHAARQPTGLALLDAMLRYLIDVFTNESLYDLPPETRSRVDAEDGWIVAGGQDDGDDSRNARLRVWSVATGEPVVALKGHKQAIVAVCYAPGLHMLLSASTDGSARLWNPADVDALASDQTLKTFTGYMSDVTSMTAAARGHRMLCASGSGALHLWDVDAGVSLRKMGIMASFFGALGLLLAYPLGALVDRFHAVRVTLFASVAVIPVPFLFYYLAHDYRALVWVEVVKAPFFNLIGAAGIPMLIALLPKEKFGQMCSANGLVKQASALLLGLFGAAIMDELTDRTLQTDNFRYAQLWMGFGFAAYALLIWVIYREWRRLGGPGNYRPPDDASPS